jgi:hypothetical protein
VHSTRKGVVDDVGRASLQHAEDFKAAVAAGFAEFLPSQAEGLMAADFPETITLTGARMVRPRGDRARQPPDPDTRRDRTPERRLRGPVMALLLGTRK